MADLLGPVLRNLALLFCRVEYDRSESPIDGLSVSSVTRRALRVHSALVELRNANEDVLDALIPFFEPILEQ